MIYVVGMGPGHIKYLTQEARDTIRQAEERIAFGRIAASAEQIATPVTRVQRVDEVLPRLDSSKHVAILASGDPCFYGILEYLKKNGIKIDRVVPGLSSFQYLMAKLQKSWHPAHFLSLHGRDENLAQIRNYPLSVLLTDKINTPHVISRRLSQLELSGRLYIGYNLSYPDERIMTKAIGDDIEEAGALSIVVVEHDLDSR